MKFVRFMSLVMLGLVALMLSPQITTAQQNTVAPKVDLVILVDESGSMWQTTDIEGKRVDAFNLLIDSIGLYDNATEDFRVSVIAFGSTDKSQIIMKFKPVNVSTVEEIKKIYKKFYDQLDTPNEKGVKAGLRWTDVLQGLKLAEEVLVDPSNGHSSDYKPAILILSDGKPETETINEAIPDANQKIAAYIEQIFSQANSLSSEPGGKFDYQGVCEPLKQGYVSIYTVIIRDGVILPPNYDNIWRRLAEQNGGDYFPAKDPDQPLRLPELGEIYDTIQKKLKCQNIGDKFMEKKVPNESAYQVESIYKSIQFQILKDTPNVEVEIYRPDGTLVESSDSLVILNRSLQDEVWSIQKGDVWAGKWKVLLKGSGTVYFKYTTTQDAYRVTPEQLPKRFIRACSPLDVALQVNGSNGKPVTTEVKDFQLTITKADGKSDTLPITPPGDTFQHSYADTCMDGQYNIEAIIKIADTMTITWRDQINVNLDPRLVVINPTEGSSYYTTDAINIETDVKVGSNDDEATASGKLDIKAELYQANQNLGSYPLTYDGSIAKARLRGEIPANSLTEGQYRLEFKGNFRKNVSVEPAPTINFEVKAGGEVAAPVPATNTPTPTITATPAPTSTPIPIPGGSGQAMGGILGGLVILVTAVAGGMYFAKLPKMPTITLENSSTGNQYVQGSFLGRWPTTKTLSFGTDSARIQFRPTKDGAQMRLLDDAEVNHGWSLLSQNTWTDLQDGDTLSKGKETYTIKIA